MLVAWSMDGLGLSLLVTMFPFFVRYIVVPDGSKAQESGYAMDPQVPILHGTCAAGHDADAALECTCWSQEMGCRWSQPSVLSTELVLLACAVLHTGKVCCTG